LAEDAPTLVGIDHGFSFPLRYYEVHRLQPDWQEFPGLRLGNDRALEPGRVGGGLTSGSISASPNIRPSITSRLEHYRALFNSTTLSAESSPRKIASMCNPQRSSAARISSANE
jgi:hypothetical protein